jgi:hypothetical protein
MKKRILSTARRRPARKRRRTTPFRPAEPAIVTGEFKGQKLRELSDEELTSFLRWDAQSQTRAVVASMFAPSQPICPDVSQYWFAKYELERRKEPLGREATSPFKLTAGDTNESIARQLLQYGYRAAARKHHSDVGGDDGCMRRLTEARAYALARLKP